MRPNRDAAQPGTVLFVDSLVISCGSDELEIQTGQNQQGVYMQSGQLAQELGLGQWRSAEPASAGQP